MSPALQGWLLHKPLVPLASVATSALQSTAAGISIALVKLNAKYSPLLPAMVPAMIRSMKLV